ncbi:MAG: ATP synthase F1 subunit epsilon [Fidelibacterota bacterium]
MATFHLEIITPTRVYDEGQVSYVRCPGLDGSFGVLAHHTRSIFALAVGMVKVVRSDEQTRYFATSGGYAEVLGDKVRLLLETAEYAGDIDIERANQAVQRAKERLQKKAHIDAMRAKASLQRALNRLQVARL